MKTGGRGALSMDNNVPVGISGVSDRLRRALVGQNRQDLLTRVGLSDRTITRILAGHPVRSGTLAALADGLGIRKEWLVEGRGEMKSEPAYGRRPSAAEAQSLMEETADFPIYSLREQVVLDRLGAALRISAAAWRDNPLPSDLAGEAKAWLARASFFLDLYDELTHQAAQSARDKSR